MSDQSVKNIEDIVVGDKLLRLDGGTNKVLKLQENIFTGGRKLGSINNGPYFFTEDHPINTTNGLKSLNASMSKEKYKHILDINELKVGDIILGHNGENTEIETINLKEVDSNTPIYNFELDGDHLYFANDFCVHNKCFKSNIEVLLADGSAKQISEIIVGDVLIGGNGEPNTVTKDDSVPIGSYGREPNWYGFNGKERMVTAEHPLMTQDGWKAIDPKEIKRLKILPGVKVTKLKIGDTIQGYDNTFTIESIEKYKAQSEEIGYNYGLDGDHTYYVKVPNTDNWLLAHNRGCFTPGTQILLATGKTKAIETITTDTEIFAFDTNENFIIKKVNFIENHTVDCYIAIKTQTRELKASIEHPIYVGEGCFTLVSNLQKDDFIYVQDNNKLKKERVIETTKIYESITVHAIDGASTYFANGVAVHERSDTSLGFDGNSFTIKELEDFKK